MDARPGTYSPAESGLMRKEKKAERESGVPPLLGQGRVRGSVSAGSTKSTRGEGRKALPMVRCCVVVRAISLMVPVSLTMVRVVAEPRRES